LIPRTVNSVLDRPETERLREHRYRFGQGFVFGAPVVFLACFAEALGGAMAGVWSGLLQALLAGWVIYVGAAGMIFEGMLLLGRRRVSADFLMGLAGIALYVPGLVGWGRVLARAPGAAVGWWFGACVLALTAWAGLQWLRIARRAGG
jgi:cation transport ATPase